MKKQKKTDLKKVVKKAERESTKNRISDFEVYTTKPIIEPKIKRKKSKEKTRDAEKTNKKKGRGKTSGPKPDGTNDKGDKEQGSRRGKASVPEPVVKRREGSSLDRILEKILPPWF